MPNDCELAGDIYTTPWRVGCRLHASKTVSIIIIWSGENFR